MKLSRIWFTIVMMAFMAVAFAGCGSNSNGSDAAGDADTAAEAETAIETESTANETETTTMEFETMDLDGNKVSSKELFAENKVTMVNFWGTFCGPCIQEMPEIEDINREYSKKGAGIIGVLVDVTEENGSLTGDAKAIIDDTGVTYGNYLGWSGFEGFLPELAVPTTWFVDGEGNVIGEHIVGADPQKYRKALDEYLSE